MASWCTKLKVVLTLRQFRVLAVRSRVVAKIDSMGSVVRRCCQ